MPVRFFKYRFIKRKRKHRYIPITPPYTHCKNCGYELHSQYCSVCGQFAHLSNRPFGESLAFFLEHHYGLDHKLGSTLYNLFFKPGFLTQEYISGRIARHVHPFKLYFFASILFFGITLGVATGKERDEKKEAKKEEKDKVESPKLSDAKRDSIEKVVAKNLKESGVSVSIGSDEDEDESAFDKVVGKLSEEKLKGKSQKEIEEMFFHNLSISLLLLMPIFAIILKLLYIRRKQYYMSHLVHSIHLHSVFFILLSVGLLWDTFVGGPEITGWVFLVMLVYLVFSLSRLYKQGIRKSLVKAFMLLFVYSFVCLVAVVCSAVYMVV